LAEPIDQLLCQYDDSLLHFGVRSCGNSDPKNGIRVSWVGQFDAVVNQTDVPCLPNLNGLTNPLTPQVLSL